ncbi:helix-turn-helix transcriptional regulator [Chitinophaga varians]|uniref:Helix-turn-helix transcriptional regulator n=1 Tax=Chitinophaga varians TaxID=2202339 RepID=A0A847RZ41_9BACT|nr:helix-turn-helix domain-containing protein [Chitinophaga varians]NLR65917.1 helix-turn-helix transcriptional regulator [Chitinophaga varians]
MTAIKESSTIQANKQLAYQQCPVTYVMEKIGGYWKPIILFHLLSGPKRYGELKRAVPGITEKVLIQQLKQLEADELINRKAEPVIPPHVTYSLTKSGKGMRDVLWAMANWAANDSKESGKIFRKNMKDFPV